MANGRRGEIDAEFDGKTYTLCLTLGALAELESGMGANDLVALAERFEAQRLSARDILRIIGCGLRGAGHAVSDADVANMKVSGGTCGLCANRGAPPRRDFRRRCAGTDEGRKPSDAAGRTSVKLVRGARAASQRAPFPCVPSMFDSLEVEVLCPA
jgi:hypothetical protein